MFTASPRCNLHEKSWRGLVKGRMMGGWWRNEWEMGGEAHTAHPRAEKKSKRKGEGAKRVVRHPLPPRGVVCTKKLGRAKTMGGRRQNKWEMGGGAHTAHPRVEKKLRESGGSETGGRT